MQRTRTVNGVSYLRSGNLPPSPASPGSGEEEDDFLGRGKKQKRGVLPKHATSIMRSWLFQHLVVSVAISPPYTVYLFRFPFAAETGNLLFYLFQHPYPTEDEKRTIAAQTNLTLLQVNNWFINARRRILQPMLDASSSADPSGRYFSCFEYEL